MGENNKKMKRDVTKQRIGPYFQNLTINDKKELLYFLI